MNTEQSIFNLKFIICFSEVIVLIPVGIANQAVLIRSHTVRFDVSVKALLMYYSNSVERLSNFMSILIKLFIQICAILEVAMQTSPFAKTINVITPPLFLQYNSSIH